MSANFITICLYIVFRGNLSMIGYNTWFSARLRTGFNLAEINRLRSHTEIVFLSHQKDSIPRISIIKSYKIKTRIISPDGPADVKRFRSHIATSFDLP